MGSLLGHVTVAQKGPLLEIAMVSSMVPSLDRSHKKYEKVNLSVTQAHYEKIRRMFI